MFDALSYAEIDGQHAELLPSRTVMSLFAHTGGGDGGGNHSCSQQAVVGLQGTNVDALTNLIGVGAGVLGLGAGNVTSQNAC
ncbi:MAG TPA: hypothetical protein VN748_20000 [Pseudonocardiaceae bacterium]|jgi:hypothetical protein|nr:hypothetical protein [Pseudonocardiaceae bacterium]